MINFIVYPIPPLKKSKLRTRSQNKKILEKTTQQQNMKII